MMKKLNLEWVSDKIGDKYKKWKKGDIVLLEAQTGTGKTHFIKNKLIPYLESNERLLYVCNRTNLKRQLKMDLLKQFGQDKMIPLDKEGKVIFEELDKITTINENITITSYHAISDSYLDAQYFGTKCDINAFDYIVCDEVHFLLADGNFNNKCRVAYEELIKRQSRNSVKIYISATMENVSSAIIKNVNKIIGEKPAIHRFNTGVDYSYLNVLYFDNNLDIVVNTIKNDTSDNKWLIFVTSKKDGYYLKNCIGEDISSIIFSGDKTKELNSIIDNSSFDKKVLVTTKVLDNGINIDDEKLTNIVIMAWDKVTFIQEIGRKRINIEDAQQVNLYIPLRYKKSFINKVMVSNELLKKIDLLKNDEVTFNRKYDNGLDKIGELNHLVYKNKKTGKWTINVIGLARLKKDMKFYEHMINKFQTKGKFAFVKQQLEWLELLETFDEGNLIEEVILDEVKQNLEQYLCSVVGKVMLEAKDRKELIEKIGLIDTHHSSIKNGSIRLLKNIGTLNSYLSEVKSNYRIKEFETSKMTEGKKKNYKQAWKVFEYS